MTWIKSPAELEKLVQALASCRAIARHRVGQPLYHHRDKVCLVQIATDRGEAFLVDSLAVDLRPLGPAMADPQLVKVLHGADYDVTTLKRDFGLRLRRALRHHDRSRALLGRSELGLVAVARDEMGVTLTKTNQKDDWSRRPLTTQQEAYALADVLHLVELRERLAARLQAAGRLEWLREECDAVAQLEPRGAAAIPTRTWPSRAPGALPPRRARGAARAHARRERRAEETDTPAFKILGSESLAQDSPSSCRRARAPCAPCPACCHGSPATLRTSWPG